jgi:hypothetical protein
VWEIDNLTVVSSFWKIPAFFSEEILGRDCATALMVTDCGSANAMAILLIVRPLKGGHMSKPV